MFSGLELRACHRPWSQGQPEASHAGADNWDAMSNNEIAPHVSPDDNAPKQR